jgi:hypothetical protein
VQIDDDTASAFYLIKPGVLTAEEIEMLVFMSASNDIYEDFIVDKDAEPFTEEVAMLPGQPTTREACTKYHRLAKRFGQALFGHEDVLEGVSVFEPCTVRHCMFSGQEIQLIRIAAAPNLN